MSINLKDFRKQLIYQQTATPVNIIQELKEIVEIERLAEIEQKKYGKLQLYFFLGMVGTIILIVTLATLSNSKFLAIVVKLLFIILIGLSIAFIYTTSKSIFHARLNLPKHRHTLTSDLVEMFARDTDKSSKIDVYLSFLRSTAKQFKLATTPHPSKKGWNIDSFQDQWLRMKGQFLDKTRFILTITGLSKTQSGWKRGISGKNKYKSKTKIVGLHVGLTLNYPQKQYGAIKVLKNEIDTAIKVPVFCKIRNIKVTDKSLHLLVRISPDIAEKSPQMYQTIAMMFLSLYQVLNLAKVLSK